jgi:hypothetical protein
LRELEIRCVIGECEYEVEFFPVRPNDSTNPRVNRIFTKLVVRKGVSTFQSHLPNFAGIIKKCNALLTITAKVLNRSDCWWLYSWESSVKFRTDISFQRWRHLLERRAVETVVLVGRKDRIWLSTPSGRLLIMSSF